MYCECAAPDWVTSTTAIAGAGDEFEVCRGCCREKNPATGPPLDVKTFSDALKHMYSPESIGSLVYGGNCTYFGVDRSDHPARLSGFEAWLPDHGWSFAPPQPESPAGRMEAMTELTRKGLLKPREALKLLKEPGDITVTKAGTGVQFLPGNLTFCLDMKDWTPHVDVADLPN